MSREDSRESIPDVEVILKKADELLNGPPASLGELERLYRTNRSRKVPLKSREQIEAPLQEGLTYLHVQGKALDSVRDLLEQLENLLEESGARIRKRKALKSIQLDLILLGDTQFNGYATFNRNSTKSRGLPFYFPDGLTQVFIRQLNLYRLVKQILEAEAPDDIQATIVRQSMISVNELLGQNCAAAEELVENFQHYSERFASHAGDEFNSEAEKKTWLSSIFRNNFAIDAQANVNPGVIKIVRRRMEKE